MKKILIILLFIVSCTPAKRLSRIIAKNPFLVQQVDTTVFFTSNSVDTSFVFNETYKKDTFVINKTNTIIYRHFDTIRIETKPITDSIIITKEIINVPVKEEKSIPFITKLGLILICIFLVSLYITRRR